MKCPAGGGIRTLPFRRGVTVPFPPMPTYKSNPFSPLTYGVRKGGRPTGRPLRDGRTDGRTGGRRGGGHPLERKLNRDVGEKGESETRVRPEGRGGSFVVLVPLRSPSSVCRSLDGWWCPCDAGKGEGERSSWDFFPSTLVQLQGGRIPRHPTSPGEKKGGRETYKEKIWRWPWPLFLQQLGGGARSLSTPPDNVVAVPLLLLNGNFL